MNGVRHHVQMRIRMSKDQAMQLEKCAEMANMTKSDVVRIGVMLFEMNLLKGRAR